MEEQNSEVLIKVKVIPNASRNQIVGYVNGQLKVKLQAIAEGGKANKALIKLLAHEYNVKEKQIIIISGEISREKLVCIKK